MGYIIRAMSLFMKTPAKFVGLLPIVPLPFLTISPWVSCANLILISSRRLAVFLPPISNSLSSWSVNPTLQQPYSKNQKYLTTISICFIIQTYFGERNKLDRDYEVITARRQKPDAGDQQEPCAEPAAYGWSAVPHR